LETELLSKLQDLKERIPESLRIQGEEFLEERKRREKKKKSKKKKTSKKGKKDGDSKGGPWDFGSGSYSDAKAKAKLKGEEYDADSYAKVPESTYEKPSNYKDDMDDFGLDSGED